MGIFHSLFQSVMEAHIPGKEGEDEDEKKALPGVWTKGGLGTGPQLMQEALQGGRHQVERFQWLTEHRQVEKGAFHAEGTANVSLAPKA